MVELICFFQLLRRHSFRPFYIPKLSDRPGSLIMLNHPHILPAASNVEPYTGTADGAGRHFDQPSIDAIQMKNMITARQIPASFTVPKKIQTNRAFPDRFGTVLTAIYKGRKFLKIFRREFVRIGATAAAMVERSTG